MLNFLKFKIEASTINRHYYNIYRRTFFCKTEKVATAEVESGKQYILTPITALNYEEISYLRNRLCKIAGIDRKETKFHTT